MAKQPHRPDYQSLPELRSQVSFPSFKVEGEKKRGPLERLLSVFADVRAGEGAGALLLTLNVFLLLGSYYLLKTAREPLILTEGGASIRAYSSAAQAAVLLILIPLYGFVGTKVNRLKLVMGLTLFFVSNLLIFQFLGKGGMRVGVAFYIWIGVFNMFAVSQFWAFANDLYTESQGKRLFPMIGVGASVGAFAGSKLAEGLFADLKLSPYQVMNVGAAILTVCAALVWLVNRIETKRGDQVMNRHADKPLGGQDGFKLVLQSRYLRAIAMLVVILNLVNTTGEFLVGSLVEQEAARQFAGNDAAMKSYIGGFFGSYYSWVNLLGIGIQTLLVSRIFAFIGVRGAMFVLPSLALISYSVIAVAPVLAIVRGAKIAENATDYSLQNTVRAALFLPTTREEKYKAKAAVDAFFVRFGDMLQAGVVKVGNELSIGLMGFAWFNVVLTVVWLGLAALLSREHRRMGF
jgi:ATP:ADP antiporter, AAA family